MSSDTLLIDTDDWLGSDTCTIGDVGGGVLAENLAGVVDGVSGFLYDDVTLPADNGKEICGRLVYVPTGLYLFAYEDGSFTASAEDGLYTAQYQLYANCIPVGSPTNLQFSFSSNPDTPPPADSSPPVLGGSLSVSNITTTSLSVSWVAATDDVAVTGYKYRVNGGSYIDHDTTTLINLSGLVPDTNYTIDVFAYDAANNLSSTLSVTASTLYESATESGFVTYPVVNMSKQTLANQGGWKVFIHEVLNGQLIATKTNLTTDAEGILRFTDGACTAGVMYRIIFVAANGDEGLTKIAPA